MVEAWDDDVWWVLATSQHVRHLIPHGDLDGLSLPQVSRLLVLDEAMSEAAGYAHAQAAHARAVAEGVRGR